MHMNNRSTLATAQQLALLCLLVLASCILPARADSPWEPPTSGAWTDPWIVTVSGIQQDQQVSGTIYIQTEVTGLDDQDFDLRYQVDGPSGFIYTAYDQPFALGGSQGWDTTNAAPGKYTLHAFLIRNHRCIAFRIVDFTIVQNTTITDIQGIEQGQVLTDPTKVQAHIQGNKPSRVLFNVTGPIGFTHTERYDPYVMLGDDGIWHVDNFPHGAYALTVTAFMGDTPVDQRSVSFYVGEAIDNPSTDEADDGIALPSIPGSSDELPDVVTDDSPDSTPDTPDESPRYSDTAPLPDGYDRGFLGINLAEVTYYTREWVFVDAMKQARPWLPTTPGSSSPWDSGQTLSLNDNGYPLLREGQAAHTIMLIDTEGAYPAGKYVCTYDGDGDIEFAFDAKVTQRSDHRIELDVNPTDNGIYLRIDRSNPNNPIRNIKVWMPGFEGSNDIFHPLYIDRLKPFSVIRFMDWMHTNTSNVVSWSDRPNDDYYTQGTNDGVALEYMIELCNELGADPWFCMPHMADDAYVHSFAKQVKLRLRPDLNVYIEWSNEVWNSQFPQHKWVKQVTNSDSLSDAFRKRWAYEANRDFQIWRDVFADEANRVIRVAASQKDNPWVTEQLVNELDGQFDAISCATYFGFTDSNQKQLNGSTNADTILEWALQDITHGSVKRNYQKHGELAREWSNKLGRTIPLISYEGGQHYTAHGGNPPYARALINAQRHHQMYNAYIANLREWKNAGGSLFTAFNFVEKPDKWGSWGQLEFMDQDINEAPKYRALLEFNAD